MKVYPMPYRPPKPERNEWPGVLLMLGFVIFVLALASILEC